MVAKDLDADAVRFPWFLGYKFFNSLFLGLSLGAVFTLYEPLSPATFSAGGVGLALATLVVATQYHYLFTLRWFFALSVAVEVVILLGVVGVLLFPLEQPLALFVYLGYQITFAFGGYLVRCETLVFVDRRLLKQLDIAKQAAYLLGMGLSWLFYTVAERAFDIATKVDQVSAVHIPLLLVQVAVILTLLVAFRKPDAPETRVG